MSAVTEESITQAIKDAAFKEEKYSDEDGNDVVFVLVNPAEIAGAVLALLPPAGREQERGLTTDERTSMDAALRQDGEVKTTIPLLDRAEAAEAEVARIRAETIEECAKVAHRFRDEQETLSAKDEDRSIGLHTLRLASWDTARKIETAIRALSNGGDNAG